MLSLRWTPTAPSTYAQSPASFPRSWSSFCMAMSGSYSPPGFSGAKTGRSDRRQPHILSHFGQASRESLVMINDGSNVGSLSLPLAICTSPLQGLMVSRYPGGRDFHCSPQRLGIGGWSSPNVEHQVVGNGTDRSRLSSLSDTLLISRERVARLTIIDLVGEFLTQGWGSTAHTRP